MCMCRSQEGRKQQSPTAANTTLPLCFFTDCEAILVHSYSMHMQQKHTVRILHRHTTFFHECTQHRVFIFYAHVDFINYFLRLMQQQAPNINLLARNESNPLYIWNCWIIQQLAYKEWCWRGQGHWVGTSKTNGTDPNMPCSSGTRISLMKVTHKHPGNNGGRVINGDWRDELSKRN